MGSGTYFSDVDEDEDFVLDKEELNEILNGSEISIKNHRWFLDSLIRKKISQPDHDPFVSDEHSQEYSDCSEESISPNPELDI